MARVGAAVGFVIGAILAIACNALTGVGDLVESADVVPDGGLLDAPVVVDATPDAPPPDTGPALPCPASGRSCAAAPPTGWEGPFLAYRGARDSVPACPTEMPEVLDENIGTPEGKVTCADCRCGDPKNTTCEATLVEFSDGVCTAPPVRVKPLNATCQTPTTAEPYLSARAAAVVTNAGSCGPFVSSADTAKAPIAWPEVLRLCRRPTDFVADGCKTGELCVPDGAQPFKTHTCIRSDEDDATCPTGWTEKLTTFLGADDTRDCSASSCSCAAPQGVTCAASIRSFTAAADCTGAATSEPTNKCVAATSGTSSQRLSLNSLGASGGGCTPSGTPTATGGLTPTAERATICCLP